MKKRKNVMAAAVALCILVSGQGLAASVPATGLAAAEPDTEATGPALPGASEAGQSSVGRELTQEEKAKLNDNVLEFDEIGDRVEQYNKDYKNTKTTIYNSVMSLGAASDLAEEANLRLEDALDLKDDDMDPETRALFEGYKESARELRKQAQKLTNADLPGTYERMLRQVKNQLTQAVQNLLLQYYSVSVRTELAVKNVELAQATLEAKQVMYSTGQVSDTDILKAQQAVAEAKSSAQSAQSGRDALKDAILLLLGWEVGADVEFAPLPEPDWNAEEAIDLAADQKAAIGANYDRMSIRTTSASGSANRSVRKRNVATAEQSVKIQIEQLYGNRMAEKQRYRSAVSEKEAADLTMEAARSKNALGMMGRIEYLGAELFWLNAKANYIDAATAYYKAVETYDWAVKGLIASDAG